MTGAAGLLDVLNNSGVDISLVRIAEDLTGTAVPLITPADVSIVIVAGANASTGVADADAAAGVIAAADVLLLQGEVGAAGRLEGRLRPPARVEPQCCSTLHRSTHSS